MNKIYMGFSVDMDRAYSLYNNNGNLINELDNNYITNKYYHDNFIEKTKKLMNYFCENNYEKSVTWFVNEADYNITVFFKEILNNCLKDGEIGLHTHFNSCKFSSSLSIISDNPDDWLITGIEIPAKKLKNFTNKDILCFKSGNHMRNDNMFENIANNGFVIDCTKVIDDYGITDDVLLFDDRNIKLGSSPFFIKTKNKNILEIPELRCGNVKKHILNCIENNTIPFIKLQIHHWQYDELIPTFDKLINDLKKDYEIVFVSLEEMAKIFFNKLMKDENKFIIDIINDKLINDTYYTSLKNIYDDNILDVIIYIFNNFKNSSKIIELFSGIGQTSYLLTKFGFNCVNILDFELSRLNMFNDVNSICDDFFKHDLNKYDCVFMTNSINSTLCTDIDKQITIYDNFLNTKENNTLIINYLKYGDYTQTYSNEIISHLKKKYFTKYLNNEYIVIKNIPIDNIIKFSDIFRSYKLINFKNVKHKIINELNYEIINLTLFSNTDKSFGVYFPIYDYKVGITHINNATFSFECKSDKPIKIKIYTGEKWINLNNNICEYYQKIQLTDNFIFNNKSTYRIGFYDITDNTNIYLKCINIKNNLI